MLQTPQRTALSGPALIRLLARLADVDVPESRQSLSDRLSQWLGWTDAIALSSALNGNPPAVAVAAGARAFGSAEEADYLRARSSLAKAITGDSVFAVARRHGSMHASSQSVPTEPAADYAVFRQRYLAIQQSMETGIGNLRGRLRAMLAARTPNMARLAVVDAVMERALSERERSLLAGVPALLAGHFERLRAAEQAALAAAEAASETASDAAAPTPGAWLNLFRQDMQSVLLAELEIRLQPVEGLLAALRSS
ncbi:Protein of unknown function (DUF3348) [Burkholderia sp. Ch1-1]|uniref:DUF3348 domain-containing protein n=1 Tax=Paraburkholderia dioscoreae TaxID=2604047 RepID=A0A5Q4ZE89_9BURK|nr:DUF3348 domain-containing protein [Paraburkholderia dioscoreae]EIF34713.1 Protein of unknown function (DUF3348) [Burkholderia sp. Ch1-1]VVD33871.1 conserved protein of unknown function [Paraburkholderia dioscoreae]